MLTSMLSKTAPFVDIRDGLTLAQAIVDTVRDPLVVLDQNLRVIAASRSFFQTFRLVSDDVRGRLLYEIDSGQWNIPELRRLLEMITKNRSAIEGYEVDREFPAIGRRIMLLNARQVFYENGPQTTVLLAFEDITGRRAIERQVQELLREKDMLLERCSTASPIACKSSLVFSSSRRALSNQKRRDCNWRTRISAFCQLAPFSNTCSSPAETSRLKSPVIYRSFAKHWRNR
jgi:PAS domain S-box-containing protein